ncbi:MAG TPA: coproporphyrinogen III oxidase, partial [Prolixibacteraceae bacterium]|nr:coproporphyrinogen III oxidase [Prolixibacteraceae bacterium]
MNRIEDIAETYAKTQEEICTLLELADGKGKFSKTTWNKTVGSGFTHVLENGNIIEKGAVNFSHVKGNFSERMERILGEKAGKYAATG